MIELSMRKGAFAITLFAFLIAFHVLPASAAYRIYLKNGSVIDGLPNIEKKGGEVRFLYHGGMIGMPDSQVVKIEEYTPGEGEKLKPEKATPPAPVPKAEKPRTEKKVNTARERQLRAQIERINTELNSLQGELDDYKKQQDEYDQVKLRIENLFEKGRNAAYTAIYSKLTASGVIPAVAAQQATQGANQSYQQYLSPAEQSMVQSNFIRKQQLETQFAGEKDVIDRDQQKKDDLEREKARLEDELKGLQTEAAF